MPTTPTLLAALSERDLDVRQCAAACEVSTVAVYAWEAGAARPTELHLEHLVSLLGLETVRAIRFAPAKKERALRRALAKIESKLRDMGRLDLARDVRTALETDTTGPA